MPMVNLTRLQQQAKLIDRRVHGAGQQKGDGRLLPAAAFLFDGEAGSGRVNAAADEIGGGVAGRTAEYGFHRGAVDQPRFTQALLLRRRDADGADNGALVKGQAG